MRNANRTQRFPDSQNRSLESMQDLAASPAESPSTQQQSQASRSDQRPVPGGGLLRHVPTEMVGRGAVTTSKILLVRRCQWS